MTPGTDERILEYMRAEGNMTPLALSRDGEQPRLDKSRQHMSNRLGKLAERGLVYKLDKGLYGLTEAGEAYLDGRLDARSLEPVADLTDPTGPLPGETEK
ncbi:hypothetical protein [Halopelagius fulvigenes]|uniref:PhiH1 repressor n=1 Tax=Halopelagius fulvigenes TaxID=1198324 RepID=A0ABD5U3G3_9EURY